MPVRCTDGEISDDDLRAWGAGPVDACIQVTCAQVRAALHGPCLARGVALLELTAAQMLKLFPDWERRRSAQRLRCWAGRLSSARVRAVLASATWHEIRAAAQHKDEAAQIRAAIAKSISRPASPSRPRPRPSPNQDST